MVPPVWAAGRGATPGGAGLVPGGSGAAPRACTDGQAAPRPGGRGSTRGASAGPPARPGRRARASVRLAGEVGRVAQVDDPEARLVLGDVLLERVQEPLHVLGGGDGPGPDHRLRRLGL